MNVTLQIPKMLYANDEYFEYLFTWLTFFYQYSLLIHKTHAFYDIYYTEAAERCFMN